MNLEIIPYKNHPCALKVFNINGNRAGQEEFGYLKDGPDFMELDGYLKHGCTDCLFECYPYDENLEIVHIYQLSREEYDDVCNSLKKILHVGPCKRCVIDFMTWE